MKMQEEIRENGTGYLKLECESCGGKLQSMKNQYWNCPHCGKSYLLDQAGQLRLNITVDYGEGEKTQSALKRIMIGLLVGLAVILLVVAIIFAFNADARNSEYFSEWRFLPSKKLVGQIFYEDIFQKGYWEISEEEFAKIKYLSYANERYEGTNDWVHIVDYSYTDYKDCTSEEEFEATIHRWTYREVAEQSPKINFSELSGLTRVCLNGEWGWNKFPKDADITYVTARTESFKSVSEMVDAEKIEILSVQIFQDLEGIEKFPNLTELTLNVWSGYNAVDFSKITACKGLQRLIVEGNPEGYIGLEQLAQLTELECFSMEDRDICLADCTFLSNLPNLKELTVFVGDEPDLSILETMPHLKSLNVFGYGDWVEVSQLKYLPELEHLSIDVTGADALQEIVKRKDLRTLDLQVELSIKGNGDWFRMETETLDLAVLSKLPKLERLTIQPEPEMPGREVTVEGIEALLGVQTLKEVRMNEQFVLPLTPIDDIVKLRIDTKQLQENPSLERLQLVNCRLEDDNGDMSETDGLLRNFPNLRVFIADYCELADIAFIAEAPELRACSLVGNQIMEFEPLKVCKKLDVVALYDNPGSTEGLSAEIVVLTSEIGESNLSEYLEGIEKEVYVIK